MRAALRKEEERLKMLEAHSSADGEKVKDVRWRHGSSQFNVAQKRRFEVIACL